VYIAEKGEEIGIVVDRLALEPVLEEMSEVDVFLIVTLGVRDTNPFDDGRQGFGGLFDEQVDMVGHQTVCVEETAGRQRFARVIGRKGHHKEQLRETAVVFFVFKDVLPIDSAEHHVVDARPARLSCPSCHIFSIKSVAKIYKIIERTKISAIKSHRGSVPL